MLTDKKIFVILSILLFVAGLCDYRSAMNNMEYIFYGLTIGVVCIHILLNGISIPKRYLISLSLFIAVCTINAVISQYCVNIFQFLIGIAVTLIPFSYFIIGYNYKFNDKEITQFIDTIIKVAIIIDVISLCETFIFNSANLIVGFVGSSIFWFQYLASINNQVIILCLALYKISNSRRYIYYIIICILYVLLSIQLKTYVGLILILVGYTLIYSKHNIIVNLLKIGLTLSVLLIVILQIPRITNKIEHYNNIYVTDNQGVARTELYNTAIDIALDHFPLGSGQGTYGSIPANTYDSKVYQDYQLEYVWGLSKYDDMNFRMDTHWASILGENGVLGTILYLLIYLLPLFSIRKFRTQYKEYYFIITMCFIVISIESLTLNLVGRLPFIIIYAGLSGLILRRISQQYKLNNK